MDDKNTIRVSHFDLTLTDSEGKMSDRILLDADKCPIAFVRQVLCVYKVQVIILSFLCCPGQLSDAGLSKCETLNTVLSLDRLRYFCEISLSTHTEMRARTHMTLHTNYVTNTIQLLFISMREICIVLYHIWCACVQKGIDRCYVCIKYNVHL